MRWLGGRLALGPFPPPPPPPPFGPPMPPGLAARPLPARRRIGRAVGRIGRRAAGRRIRGRLGGLPRTGFHDRQQLAEIGLLVRQRVAPRDSGCVRSGRGGVFPFGLRRQPIHSPGTDLLGLLVEQLAKRVGLVPRDERRGKLVPRCLRARLDPHDRTHLAARDFVHTPM